jgi:hypothetical protein
VLHGLPLGDGGLQLRVKLQLHGRIDGVRVCGCVWVWVCVCMRVDSSGGKCGGGAQPVEAVVGWEGGGAVCVCVCACVYWCDVDFFYD